MKVALVDMDGCVADDDLRKWILIDESFETDEERYELYHRSMCNDEPFKGIINGVNSLPADVLVVILTGRPEKYKEETLKQLTEWGVRHDHLIMRKDNDKQSSVTMKKHVALHMIEIGLDIVKAIDDRVDICAMYRELEIETIEVKHYE